MFYLKNDEIKKIILNEQLIETLTYDLIFYNESEQSETIIQKLPTTTSSRYSSFEFEDLIKPGNYTFYLKYDDETIYNDLCKVEYVSKNIIEIIDTDKKIIEIIDEK